MKPVALSLAIVLVISFSCQETEPDIIDDNLPSPGSILSSRELGRALFYDVNLSADRSVSCASCHKQEYGFADNLALSKGVAGNLTTRNSMPIQNLQISFPEDTSVSAPLFWDGREQELLQMVLQPFVNNHEHGFNSLKELEDRVNSLSYYKKPFQNFFSTSSARSEFIASSLVEFITSIQTNKTRFDIFQQTNEGLDEKELRGMSLFFETYNCNSCHQVQDPSGYLEGGGGGGSQGFSNIGLEMNPQDVGLEKTTGQRSDQGKFKIPSLRNVVYTAPYMHNGGVQTLDSVIEHYSTGLLATENLDPILKDENGEPLVLNITKAEKEAIIAFLGTLTDKSILEDEKFSDPFNR
ncbi:MAG: cytochrome c peroxidase [Marinoscillum sp.]